MAVRHLCMQYSIPMSCLLSNYLIKNPRKSYFQVTRLYSAIHNIFNSEQNTMLHVHWKDGDSCAYPFIFLRDNCSCPHCIHPDSKGRIIDLFSKDSSTTFEPAQTKLDNGDVVIKWTDDHTSTFPNSWLLQRKFPSSMEKIKSQTLFGLEPTIWNGNLMKENFPRFQYTVLGSNNLQKIKLIESLILYGACLIEKAPKEYGVVKKISQLIAHGYLKNTHYGYSFKVEVKPAANNLAYTSMDLPVHLDLPQLRYAPELQMLHCIEHNGGTTREGCNVLVDGFYAAENLRKKNQESFDILSTVKFQYGDVGDDIYGEFDMQMERPFLGIDSFGNLESVAHNNQTRGSFVNAPSELVYKAYQALFQLTNELHARENEFHWKLREGDILIFNNKRVLHGRKAYDPSATSRCLEGAYLDWDEVLSKYRVLRKQSSREN